MANITQSDHLSKLLCADIYLDHNEGSNPLTTLQPMAHVVGTAHTGPGDSYHYELSYVRARGVGFGRNVLNELREPLMAHIRGMFCPPIPIYPPIPNYPKGGLDNHRGPDIYEASLDNIKQGDKLMASDYLTSEDYQYDRGEELRERAADPTNL